MEVLKLHNKFYKIRTLNMHKCWNFDSQLQASSATASQWHWLIKKVIMNQ